MKERRSSSTIQVLLLEDVEGLGRKGEVAEAKPGHARNYVIPQKKGVIADAFTLRMRDRLKAEREKQAIIDRQEAEQLASQVSGLTLAHHVKVDPEGHMYGSVKPQDIVEIMAREGITLERSFIILPVPIKVIGQHKIELRLKEGVQCTFSLKVLPEGMDELPVVEEEVREEVPAAAPEEQESSEAQD